MSGADNQQERLGSSNWFLAGFIEGEGCLSVSIKAHPTCRSRFYVDPGFFLYPHESGRKILELAKCTFASGHIYLKSGSPKVLVYEVSSTLALRVERHSFLRAVHRAVQLQGSDVRAAS